MKHLYKLFSSSFLSLSLIGCGTTIFSNRSDNPIIQDFNFLSDKTHVYGTKASHRLAIISNKLICAEPPPDVGEAFASSVANELKLALSGTQATGQEAKADIENKYSRAIATQIAPLLYRTQGLQYFRDSIHKLCIERMNGWLTPDQYNTQMGIILKNTDELIKLELPLMKEIIKDFYTNARAGDTKLPEIK